MDPIVKEFYEAYKRLKSVSGLAAKVGKATPEAVPHIFNDFRVQLDAVEKTFVRAFPALAPADGRAIRTLIKECRAFTSAQFIAAAPNLGRRMEIAWASMPKEVKTDRIVHDTLAAVSEEYGGKPGEEEAAKDEADEFIDAHSKNTARIRRKGARFTTKTLAATSGMSKKTYRLIIILSAVALILAAFLVWFFLFRNPGGGSANAPEENPKAQPKAIVKADPQPEKGLKVQALATGFGTSDDTLLGAANATSSLALLDVLDRRYSRAPEGRPSLDRMLEGLTAENAVWRKTGTAAALAEAFTLAARFEVYPAHEGLLPSEIVAAQGGRPFPIGIVYLYAAARLSLSIERLDAQKREGGEEYAPRLKGGDFYFARVAAFKGGEPLSVDDAVTRLLEQLIERELAALKPRIGELFDVLAARKNAPELANTLYTRYRDGLLALGDKRTQEQAGELLALLLKSTPEIATRETIGPMIAVLGSRATRKWYERLYALLPDYTGADGVSGAEMLADALIAEGAAEREHIVELFKWAMTLTPARKAAIEAKLAALNEASMTLELARQRYDGGDRSETVVTMLVKQALNDDRKGQALALLSILLKSGTALSARGPEIAKQAVMLCLELRQWEEGKRLLTIARAYWPDDAAFVKLDALLFINSGEREAGLARLRKYVEEHPADKAAADLLAELG